MLGKHLKDNEAFEYSEILGKRVIEFNLLDELKFDAETLNDDIREHPQKIAMIVEMYDQKKHSLEMLEAEYYVWKNKLWGQVKTNETDASGKVYSDDRVTAMVAGSPTTEKYLTEISTLKLAVKRLENAVDRFKDRKDLLQSFAGNLRSNQ